MKIIRHRLHNDDGTALPFLRSPNMGGRIEPLYLVMHYTAAGSAADAIRTLTDPAAGVSAHLVIARGGSITQLVPFDREAWHAGQSRWEGLEGLNRHSLGIELDNAGALTRHGDKWRAWFGREYEPEEVIEAVHKHETAPRGWHIFPAEQLVAAIDVARLLVKRYGLRDVIGHDDIAAARKSDPGPAFPMDSFRAAAIGCAENDPPLFDTITFLNIRIAPGLEFEKLDASPLPPQTRLKMHGRESDWYLMDVLDANGTPDLSGWVHGAYIRRVD